MAKKKRAKKSSLRKKSARKSIRRSRRTVVKKVIPPVVIKVAQTTTPSRPTLSSHAPTLLLMMVLSALGALLSAYLLFLFYSPSHGFLCAVGQNYSCDIVTSSSYATLGRVPISLWSFVLFLIVFEVSYNLKKYQKIHLLGKEFGDLTLLRFSTAILLLMSLLFLLQTYAQVFLLRSLCFLCLLQQIIALTLLCLSAHNLNSYNAPPQRKVIVSKEKCEFC